MDGPEELSIESLPAVHARGLMGRLLPPAMGSLLEHRVNGNVTRRVMFSGDTLTGEHLNLIHERHPRVDVAVMHLGGTRVLWHTVTMDAVQGVDYLQRIRPERAIPVHYDDYRVFRSPLSDFLDSATRACLKSVVQPVGRGDRIPL